MTQEKLTPAQKAVYELLMEDGDITEVATHVLGIRWKTLERLQEKGYARYLPYGNPPRWKGIKQ